MKKLLILSLLLSLQVSVTSVMASTYDILRDMNVYRAKYNLAPLQTDSRLCDLAKIRTEQIKTDWSHKQFQAEIDKMPSMSGVFHENLARTFEAQDVVWAWSMSQAGHREAMLIPEMKYGCVVQSGDYYSFEGYIPAKVEQSTYLATF